jgi:hypothetical protein
MRKRRRIRGAIPWWGLMAAGGFAFLVGLLLLCTVMITYLIVSGHDNADAPSWLAGICAGPGILLMLAGVPPVVIKGIRVARSYLQPEWVSVHDLREEYRDDR